MSAEIINVFDSEVSTSNSEVKFKDEIMVRQTRENKFPEDEVHRPAIHFCVRSASLKRQTDVYKL